MLKLWRVNKHLYITSNKPTYDVTPLRMLEYLMCCCKYYGIRGLRWCYLFKWQADRKARKLNDEVNK